MHTLSYFGASDVSASRGDHVSVSFLPAISLSLLWAVLCIKG